MKPALIALMLTILIISSGCIQREEAPVVQERSASDEWKADGIIGENEYSRSMHLLAPSRQGYMGGDMEVSWKNDGDYLFLGLNGSTDGWLAVGFDPLEWMKNSDIILASVQSGKAVVLDEYCTGNYGPHIEDTMLGGSSDIVESGGRLAAGRTIVELKRKLDTGDRFDRAFAPGQAVSLIWALSKNPDIGQKHNVAYGEGILTLTTAETAPDAPGGAVAALSSAEKEGLLFIWEEEKAARDLYSSFYNDNNLTIFPDLARSESSHMDQARAVIDRHNLTIPDNNEGVFENQTLQRIHDDLLAEGEKSDADALKAAAAFEEISILDLERELAAAETEEVKTVYQGLLAGSRKHLRSYVSDLKDQGIEYRPRYLEMGEFEDTVKA